MSKKSSKKLILRKAFVCICFVVVGESTYYLMQEFNGLDYYLVPPLYLDSVEEYYKFRVSHFFVPGFILQFKS